MLGVGLVVVALLTGLGLQLSLTMKLLLFTTASQLLLEVLLCLLLMLLNDEACKNRHERGERERVTGRKGKMTEKEERKG